MTVHSTVILTAIGQSLMWTTLIVALAESLQQARHERLETRRQRIVRVFQGEDPAARQRHQLIGVRQRGGHFAFVGVFDARPHVGGVVDRRAPC